MAHPRPEKVAEVQDLEQRLRSSPVVILTDYRGLTVSEIRALRSRLREAALEYRVAKNTLLTRAARQAGLPALSAYLSGPTAVVFGRDDPGTPSRILQEFIRQYRKLTIKGGVVEGQALGAEAVQSLATLPGKAELLARVVGLVQAPLRGLVGVLAAPPRQLATALDALRKQREEAERAAGAAPAAQPGGETPAGAGAPGVPGEPAAAPAT
jgi:large subunit ribosomal protein L10